MGGSAEAVSTRRTRGVLALSRYTVRRRGGGSATQVPGIDRGFGRIVVRWVGRGIGPITTLWDPLGRRGGTDRLG